MVGRSGIGRGWGDRQYNQRVEVRAAMNKKQLAKKRRAIAKETRGQRKNDLLQSAIVFDDEDMLLQEIALNALSLRRKLIECSDLFQPETPDTSSTDPYYLEELGQQIFPCKLVEDFLVFDDLHCWEIPEEIKEGFSHLPIAFQTALAFDPVRDFLLDFCKKRPDYPFVFALKVFCVYSQHPKFREDAEDLW